MFRNKNDLALTLSKKIQGLQKLVSSETKFLISLGRIGIMGTFLSLQLKHSTTFHAARELVFFTIGNRHITHICTSAD